MNETMSGMQEESASFKEVLKKTSLNIEWLSAGQPDSLSKTQLVELLGNLQIEMNRHLMNALSADTKDDIDCGHTFQFNRLMLSSVDSSNNLQANQKNDVFIVRKILILLSIKRLKRTESNLP